MSRGSASVFMIGAVFALMFALLYFASQSDSAIPTRPELSESEIRELLTARISQTDGADRVEFAIDHPRAGDRHFPLLFYGSDGTLYRINSTDSSIVGNCTPSNDDNCPVNDPLILSEIKGRLAYFVEVSQITISNESSWHRYFIDANNGDILYSN